MGRQSADTGDCSSFPVSRWQSMLASSKHGRSLTLTKQLDFNHDIEDSLNLAKNVLISSHWCVQNTKHYFKQVFSISLVYCGKSDKIKYIQTRQYSYWIRSIFDCAVDTILPNCNAQRKWRSCSHGEIISCRWWWNSSREILETKKLRFDGCLTLHVLYNFLLVQSSYVCCIYS